MSVTAPATPRHPARRSAVVAGSAPEVAVVVEVLERGGWEIGPLVDADAQPLASLTPGLVVCVGQSAADVLRSVTEARQSWAEASVLAIVPASETHCLAEIVRAGADDFLTAPFAEIALELRVRLIERQSDLATEVGHLGAQVEALARIDLLTGVLSQRDILARLGLELRRWSRFGAEVTAVVVGCDALERINEQFGFAAGSQVLRAIGRVLVGNLRDTDAVGRIGGSTFLVVLVGCPGSAVEETVGRLLGLLEVGLLGVGAAAPLASVSMGAVSPGHGDPPDPEELVRRGRLALASARVDGGRCLRVWRDAPPDGSDDPS